MGILNNLGESCNQTRHSVWMLNGVWVHTVSDLDKSRLEKKGKIFSIGADTDTEYQVGASLA